MGGICGIVRFGGDPRGLDAVRRMTVAMSFRGPDGIGHWQDETAALGHCLLRTTEEVADERQPLVNDDGSLVLVVDGTLWNAPELRADLIRAGARLRSRTDSELVLSAYETWDRDFLSRIDGDFAVAIWDRRRRELFCARDRMGMRPFHYHVSPELGFCFASDPEAILAIPGMPHRLDEGRIADAIVGGLEGFDAHSTLFRDIARLPAAYELTVNAGAVAESRYWTFAPPAILKLKSDAAYRDALLAILKEAVRCRLRGGTTTAAMLSGGLDSTTVAALGRRIRAEEGKGPLDTFSAVGPDPDICIETHMIGAAASIGGIRAHFVDHAGLGALEEELSALTLNPRSPFDRHMTLVRAVYLAAHRAGFKAMIDGVGGDLVFADGGHLPYLLRKGRWLAAVQEARSEQAFWGGGEGAATRLARAARLAVTHDWMRRLRRRLRRYSVGTPAQPAQSLIDPAFARRVAVQDRLRTQNERRRVDFAPGTPEQRASGLFRARIVAARERYEREASRLGIEPRDPFLDLRVVSFCLSLPVEQITRDGWPKYLLRTAMAGELPEALRWRRGRSHLGWTFTTAVLQATRRRDTLVRGADLERIAPYIDVARLKSDLEAYLGGVDLPNKRLEQVYAGIVLARWLESNDVAHRAGTRGG